MLLELFSPHPVTEQQITKMIYESEYTTPGVEYGLDNDHHDRVVVPLTLELNDTGELERYAAELLVAAASRRNLMVFDSDAEPGIASVRLLSLLNQTMRRYCNHGFMRNRVTDVFVSEESLVPAAFIENVYGIKTHPVQMELWEYMTWFCQDQLEFVMAPNDREYILALNLQTNDNLVMPINHEAGRCGLAVLDNTRTLLGSF